MSSKKLEELRDYYDNTSLADEIAETELNAEVVQSPMVGITVRLPAELLERVRKRARRRGVKTTALIRQWIEDSVDTDDSLAPAARRRVAPAGASQIISVAGIYESEGAAVQVVVGGGLADLLPPTSEVFKTLSTCSDWYPRRYVEEEGRLSV